MADDKNLATLKVTVTADKSPLKKALDSAKQDTERKSTSQIQGDACRKSGKQCPLFL